MFRSSPPEVFSNKDTVQIRSKPTGEQTRRSATPAKPLCNFIAITPMHGCTPRIHITPAKHPSPGEHFWETAPVCQNSFKRYNYKKLLLTTVKRNLLRLKNK